MQMRIILAMGSAHCYDLLSARNSLAPFLQDCVQVPIKRIDVFDSAVFPEGVTDNDDIAPTSVDITREDDDSISNTINRILKIRVAPPNTIPIFSHMPARTEAARFVIALSLWFTDRKIKTIGYLGRCGFCSAIG